jgi:hypothetical protein
MKMNVMAITVMATTVALASGCASTSSTRAKPLEVSGQAKAISECRSLTVLPFGVPPRSKADASTGVAFSAEIAARLKSDFGPLFESVQTADRKQGIEGECVLSGEITKYKPGSKVARFILIGLGAASLEGNIKVADGASDAGLFTAPFDKLWAWGGIAGASKGIDDMLKETAAAIANTVAQEKGWQPPR